MVAYTLVFFVYAKSQSPYSWTAPLKAAANGGGKFVVTVLPEVQIRFRGHDGIFTDSLKGEELSKLTICVGRANLVGLAKSWGNYEGP